jgi:hypothetical protein
MVFCAVTFIKGFKAFARKVLTLITESNEAFSKHLAPVTHMKAVFAARQATLAIHSFEALLVQIIFHRQVTDAYTAVHPAGSNKLFLHLRSPLAHKNIIKLFIKIILVHDLKQICITSAAETYPLLNLRRLRINLAVYYAHLAKFII